MIGVGNDPSGEVTPSAAGRDGGQERIQAELCTQVVSDGPAQQPP